jgi:hypothetical protein
MATLSQSDWRAHKCTEKYTTEREMGVQNTYYYEVIISRFVEKAKEKTKIYIHELGK